MNSESCLLREEGQMVLCKVDSVVSSGEMNGFQADFPASFTFTLTLTATPDRWTQQSRSSVRRCTWYSGGNWA